MGKYYEQLSLSERIYIQSQLELGFKAAAIAAALKREPSTISAGATSVATATPSIRRGYWRKRE